MGGYSGLLVVVFVGGGRGGRFACQRRHFRARNGARLRRRRGLDQELCGGGEFLFEVEIGDALEGWDLRDTLLVDQAFHTVSQPEMDLQLFSDGEAAQVPEHHRPASSYSSTNSPAAMRAAIFSWHGTQKRAHGSASRRFGEIGSSHSAQTPYVP